MQNYQQITNRSEKRSRYFQAFGTLDSKITLSKFSLILAVCMITFTSLLFTKTLEIQHSCKPMIHYGTLPTECQLSEISSNNTKPESKTQSNSVTKLVNDHPDDVVGGIVGVATAAGTAAAAGATAAFSIPAAGAVAIGLGIWYTIRTVF
jgi:hypothetical protein